MGLFILSWGRWYIDEEGHRVQLPKHLNNYWIMGFGSILFHSLRALARGLSLESE